MISTSSKDLEFLLSIKPEPLENYFKLISVDEKERIIHWRTTHDVPVSDIMKLSLTVKNLRKALKMPAKSEKIADFAPIQAEKFWIDQAREKVDFFIEYVSGKTPAIHHKYWLAHIFNPAYPFVNIISPPGAAKTHVLVYALAYVMGYDPLTTNSLITVSSTQAEDRMEMLKEIVTENRAYKNVFPEVEVNPKFPNNTEEFSLRIKEQYMAYDAWSTLRQQKGEPHDPTFKSVGYGGKSVIGSRWSGLMGIDDIVDESMSTPDQQKKVGRYIINTLMGRLVPHRGRGVNIGNRWMIGDVPEQLKNNKRWFTIETPAWRIDEFGVKRSYWPDLFPIEDLEAIKEGMAEYPGLFDTTYLLNAQAASIQLFTEILLSRDVPDLMHLPKFKGIYITTDFALGIEQRNDWTVFQAVGLDYDGNYYILDQRRVKETDDDSPDTLVAFVDYIAWTYGRMDMIYVEKVAFSGTMGTLLMKTRAGLPVQKIVPIGNKGHRAALVSSLAKRGQLFINQTMQDIGQLKTEWMNFGMYPHDDTLDPMGLILQAHGMSTVTATYSTIKSPYLY